MYSEVEFYILCIKYITAPNYCFLVGAVTDYL